MDRKKILELLQQKKVQDYSYSIVFFLIFSFFVYFAIRPNLITAFNLQKELQDVKLQNREYEEKIMQIVNYQSTVEQYRDKFHLLDEAIPNEPQIASIIEDVRTSASSSGTILQSLNAQSVTYKKEKTKKIMTYTVNLTTKSDISQVELLITNLINQRRIKTVDSIKLTSEDVEGVRVYTVTFDINSYYL
jgi:Tfp pilus assembly protein PilO